MLVDEVDVDAVLGDVDDAGLQGRVDTAERHMHGLGAIGREHGVLGRGRLHADLQALDVTDIVDLALGIHMAHALRAGRDHMQALRGLVDQRLQRLEHFWIGEALDHVVLVAEQEV